MIIVIGKEDKALMLDAAAYVDQCGKNFYHDGLTKYKEAKVFDEDCKKIANRLRKSVRGQLRPILKAKEVIFFLFAIIHLKNKSL